MIHRLFLVVVVALAVTAPSSRQASAQADRLCFPEVPGISNCIEGRFREYWVQNGGLPVFGYPVSPATMQQTAEGTFLTQYFERNRFELHPEKQRPYDVLLGRLGDDRLKQQGRDWFGLPKADPAAPHFFPDTAHAIAHGPFWDYWSSHGLEFDGRNGKVAGESLALFGLPISEPQQETNANGDTVLTQWFERARFEDHGAKGVLLGLLGVETGGSAPPPPGGQPAPPPPAPMDDAAYGNHLRANFSQVGPYRLQLEDVSIVHVADNHHAALFKLSGPDVDWLLDNGQSADMHAWGARALQEVKGRWPNQTVSAHLVWFFYSFTNIESSDCIHQGSFNPDRGWFYDATFVQTLYVPGDRDVVEVCVSANSSAPPVSPPPASPPSPRDGCDSSYPTICIPAGAADLDCGEIPHRNFPVLGADRHRFDADNDGTGCESG